MLIYLWRVPHLVLRLADRVDVAHLLLVVVDHVVVGGPARGPQLDDVQDLDAGHEVQLLVAADGAEHGHQLVQLVLVQRVQLQPHLTPDIFTVEADIFTRAPGAGRSRGRRGRRGR